MVLGTAAMQRPPALARQAALLAVLLAALLAGALAGPLAADHLPAAVDQLQPSLNESVDLAALMAEMAWPGPQVGCATVGGLEELRLECALPAGRLTLATDRATFLAITCEADENDNIGAGRFLCEEVKEHAGRELQQAGVADEGPLVLRSLSLQGCALAEPLQCALQLAGARDVAALTLRDVPTPLRPHHLAGISAITQLRIIGTSRNVSEVPYEALATQSGLRRFDMSGGALRLAVRWRPALPALRALQLSDSALRHVPAGAFDGLPLLRNLSLFGNQIENLTDDSLQGLPELERLSLNSNALKWLPKRLLQPTPRLKLLNLHGNELRALPRGLLNNLQYMEDIWLNNKNGSEIILEADTFANLTSLHTLKIESCGLRAVPAELLRGARALRTLSLRGNALGELPAALLAEHAALRSLDLARNRLRTLPQALLSAATQLEHLDLNRNAIRTLPRGVFRSLTNLKTLDLSYNMLEKVNSGVFEGLKSIEKLSLSYNNVTLEADGPSADGARRSPLAALRSLRHLALRNNSVRAFMDDWRDFVFLETLDLSYNAITELSDVDMELLSVAEVDLRHNDIRMIRFDDTWRDSDEGLFSKATFYLDENPFICDCFMYKFVTALTKPEVAKRFQIGSAQCAGPPALAGTPLLQAPRDALVCALPAAACPARCACTVRPAAALLDLDCDADAVPQAAPPPARYGATAVRLRLRSALARLPALPPEIRIVDLSGLGLTAAPELSACSDDLIVDLSGNNMTVAPLSLLASNCKVRLAGNEMICDCDHRDFIAGLERHWSQVLDGSYLRCRGGGRVEGTPAARLCAMRNAIVLGGSLAAVGLLLAALAVLAFKYSTEIRLVLRRYEWLDFLFEDKYSLGTEKKYDAFVSFSHRDDEFVRDELVPRLEGGRRPLKLCLHYRDWEIGGVIPQQIDRSVRDSRRTIVVLSRDFLESGWGRVEFRAAHGLERVIVILRGDVLRADGMDEELRAYLTTNTYVHADDPLVWDRVREAVRRSRSVAPVAPVAPAAPAAAAPPADKLTRGALDVQLRDGQLVNVKC